MYAQAGNGGGSPPEQAPSFWLRIGFWVCIAISVAVVVRRVIALAYPPHSAPPQLAALDAAFASHATLTLAHIIPALVFVLVSPFVVFRTSTETVWPERLLFPLGAVVGLTAYAMSVFSVGGWVERSAVLFFNTLFSVLVVVCLLAWATRRVAFEATMDDTGNRDSSWNRHYAAGDGHILRHQPSDPS